MIGRLNHVAIAVPDLAAATAVYRDTLGATTERMASHTAAVARGAPGKLIIADLPFLAVRRGRASALDAAAALLRAGAHAVKPEGARGHLDVIAHMVESGIPVVGHLGLTPQSVHALGGFRVQAREPAAAARLREDAAAPPAPLRSCSSACPPRSPPRSRRRCPSPPSASARARAAPARCSSCTTCSASATARSRRARASCAHSQTPPRPSSPASTPKAVPRRASGRYARA